jgi:hypothetical protein
MHFRIGSSLPRMRDRRSASSDRSGKRIQIAKANVRPPTPLRALEDQRRSTGLVHSKGRRALPHRRYDAQRDLCLRSSRRRALEQARLRAAYRSWRSRRFVRRRQGMPLELPSRWRSLCRSYPARRCADRFVDLRCTWPTSCAFGGPDFATLYVTSARFTMTAEHIDAHPEEGALFALEVGARGRAEHRFK